MKRVEKKHFLAEEAVQETYYRALRYSHCFNEDKSTLDTWLSTILNNCVRSIMAEERGRGLSIDAVINIEDPKLDLELAYHKLRIKRRIERYKEGVHKDILHLYFNMDLKYKDIGLITSASSQDMTRQTIHRFKKAVVNET